MRIRSVAAALPVLSVLAVVAVAAPAQAAAPLDRSHYEGSQPISECGGAYTGTATFSGRILISDTNPSLHGQFFRFSDHYQFRDVLTNVETGESVTIEGKGVFKELQPRSEDGQVFSYITHDSGTITLRDSSGNVVLRESGLVEFAYTFDTLGDGEPGGDQLTETFVRTAGPHATFDEGFDFCALLDEVTAVD